MIIGFDTTPSPQYNIIKKLCYTCGCKKKKKNKNKKKNKKQKKKQKKK